jgi:hypothetical protein
MAIYWSYAGSVEGRRAASFALQKGRNQSADDGRHFGLVVDDLRSARCLRVPHERRAF